MQTKLVWLLYQINRFYWAPIHTFAPIKNITVVKYSDPLTHKWCSYIDDLYTAHNLITKSIFPCQARITQVGFGFV